MVGLRYHVFGGKGCAEPWCRIQVFTLLKKPDRKRRRTGREKRGLVVGKPKASEPAWEEKTSKRGGKIDRKWGSSEKGTPSRCVGGKVALSITEDKQLGQMKRGIKEENCGGGRVGSEIQESHRGEGNAVT